MATADMTDYDREFEHYCVTTEPDWTDDDIKKINQLREILKTKRLIGVDETGETFGNVSFEWCGFPVISGTKTGGLNHLTAEHYTRITDFSINRAFVKSFGPIRHSRETPAHVVLQHIEDYVLDETSQDAMVVVHVHYPVSVWSGLKGRLPTSHDNVGYGTVGMAREVVRLYRDTDLRDIGMLVMGGHKGGAIAFGKDYDAVEYIIMKHM